MLRARKCASSKKRLPRIPRSEGSRTSGKFPQRTRFPMFATPSGRSLQRAVPKRSFRDWLCFTSTDEIASVLEAVVAAMQRRGYSEKEIFGVRLALEEALVNAAKHGNRKDYTK